VIAVGAPAEPALAARLAAIALDVAPLAERPADVPALAAAVAATLAARGGRPTPAFSPGALARLARHGWAGDVPELEAVVGRALAATDAAAIELEHLGLDPEPAPADVTTEAPPAASNGRLDVLLGELSHELLNPLQAVKTFTSMAPRLLADPELPALAAHADEAVDRVRTLFQNVVDFARVGEARREPVEVSALLDRLLAEVEPELARRAVRVRRTGEAHAMCAGDPEQLEQALRNLMAGVVREVPPREEFVVDTGANGVVRVRLSAGEGAARRLRRLLAPEARTDLADPTLLPLSFTIARTLLERNGATLGVLEEVGGPTTLVVRLPGAGVG
jgi:signal transduction histidine kinase